VENYSARKTNKMLERAKKLLVVDDESVIAEFMSRVLSKQGFVVDVSTNGETAKGLIAASDYEVVIIDIRMPKMNGKQLYDYIKSNHPVLADRVIFTSGELVDAGTVSFLTSENRPFLNKPFGSEALKAVVGKTLQAIEDRRGPSAEDERKVE
jgi:DNA-binding NtrC family response regulator